jgi:hypothetical protein
MSRRGKEAKALHLHKPEDPVHPEGDIIRDKRKTQEASLHRQG